MCSQIYSRTGKLPKEGVEANVAPVFKKRDRHTASNYRPISLTCVCAKLLEHIICKNIMTHFTKNTILTSVKHSFLAEHSCRSQLLLTTEDLKQNYEDKIQTDFIVLDFSKAFDVVPHQRLLHKLDHYGIRGLFGYCSCRFWCTTGYSTWPDLISILY